MMTWAGTFVRSALCVTIAAFGTAACGEADPDPASDERNGGGPHLPAPPDVRVQYAGDSVDLHAWTYCYGNGCVDGFGSSNPPDIGHPEQVIIEYPLHDWTFKASFEPAGQECPRSFPAKTEEIAPGRFVLRPAGYAGEYDVTLSGEGPDGDSFTTFRWTTRSDGPLPSPSSYVAIVSDLDGSQTSYGVEMDVSQLAETPEHVRSTITVTAADGDSLTFSPRLTRSTCEGEGSLDWRGPEAKGHAAAALGPAPFSYDVELVLDGRTYEAHAAWPDDVIPGFAPNVRLDFSPSLPALH